MLIDINYFVGNSTIALILINSGWESVIVLREFMKRIFTHKKESDCKVSAQPLTKPVPAFESPLKDSYNNSYVLSKDNTKYSLVSWLLTLMRFIRLIWGSPSGMIQSPLKFSTPSPKLSDRVTSPLVNSSAAINPAMYLSPSKGPGIGATWSAALDEQLNKPSGTDSSSHKSISNELAKDIVSGPQTSRAEFGKVAKPAKIILDREILSPELVMLIVMICY